MDIGDFICKCRKDARLTQYELAKKINKSIKALQSYERGETSPRLETIQDMAKLFDFEIIIKPNNYKKNSGLLEKLTTKELLKEILKREEKEPSSNLKLWK
ncbi:MAG: helix-turn-helix domain-containing protein [Clostridium sp.]